jgi:hypothetical protein
MISRYFILLILTCPFIIAGILTALTQYKLRHITKKRFIAQTTIWGFIFVSLASAKSIYEGLLSHGLTDTDSLSLFDVVQITAIVMLFYIANRTRLKIESIEGRLERLHQELSIELSKK